MSRSVASDSLIFTGRDGVECDEFITSITRIAYENGEIRNNDWFIDTVRVSLRGRALRWFVGLDEDVQTNWRLLQQAMILQYPNEDDDEGPSSAMARSHTIPTPAAAPKASSGVWSIEPRSSGFSVTTGAEADSWISTPPTTPGVWDIETRSKAFSVIPAEEPILSGSSESGDIQRLSTNVTLEPTEAATSSTVPSDEEDEHLSSGPAETAFPNSTSPQMLTSARLGRIRVVVNGDTSVPGSTGPSYVSSLPIKSILARVGGTLGKRENPAEALVCNLEVTGSTCRIALLNNSPTRLWLGLQWFDPVHMTVAKHFVGRPHITKGPAKGLGRGTTNEGAIVPVHEDGPGSFSCLLNSTWWKGPCAADVWELSDDELKAVWTDDTGARYPLAIVLHYTQGIASLKVVSDPGAFNAKIVGNVIQVRLFFDLAL